MSKSDIFPTPFPLSQKGPWKQNFVLKTLRSQKTVLEATFQAPYQACNSETESAK